MHLWRIVLSSRFVMSLAVVVLLATAIFLSTLTSSRADTEPKRVMMLHSFGLRFKPWTDYAQFIRSEISRRAQRPIEFDDQSLLNARLTNDKTDGPFVDYLRALYVEKPPDLIIAIGAPAANFVQRYRPQIFPGTPMLFTGVEARRVRYDQLTEDDTVVAPAHDFPGSFETILRVLPQTKTIAIVNGVSPNETFWLGELKRETAPLAGRVELKFYNELSFDDRTGGGIGGTGVKAEPVALGKRKSLVRKRRQFRIGDSQVTHAVNHEQVYDASAYRSAWFLAIKATFDAPLRYAKCPVMRGAPDIPTSQRTSLPDRCC